MHYIFVHIILFIYFVYTVLIDTAFYMKYDVFIWLDKSSY